MAAQGLPLRPFTGEESGSEGPEDRDLELPELITSKVSAFLGTVGVGAVHQALPVRIPARLEGAGDADYR